ncbi:DUF2256 domain-containing protein [Enterovibrio sp. 27052020O]|uniref:DUF2256 domain-containing protein n=1 Tax=Enterovibrio sp. 27052020O TaxID=3241166 RepID=UPI00388FF9BA
MKKKTLPSKTCAVCERPFTWRKKWERVWDDVKYCSKRCAGSRTPKKSSQQENPSKRDKNDNESRSITFDFG